jgi:hypothetical protein
MWLETDLALIAKSSSGLSGVTVLAVSLHAMHQQLSQALQVVLRAAATHYATEVKGMSKQNNSPVNFA